MLAATPPLLRRRGTGHVVKYLEGVPTPTKLIDHLAGADLHASAELPFFTTVPRYIDPQREQRLSRLFFHHVLYPAGGARLPYQAVVVRNARAVRTSGAAASAAVTSTTPRDAETPAEKPAAPRANPLAVPAAHLVGSPLRAQDTPATSPAAWARVDPARRPFFAAKLPRSGGLQSFPSSSQPQPRTASEDTGRSSRVVEDSVLAPLRGVLEHYFNAQPAVPERGSRRPHDVADRVRSLLVSPASGLLWMEPGTPAGDRPSAAPGADTSSRANWDDVLASAQRRVARGAAQLTDTASTFQYVQTRLPPSATVELPLPCGDGEGEASRMLYRLAGGLEPVVPFAVGRPLAQSTATASLSERHFPHLSCLARLNLRVPVVSSVPRRREDGEHTAAAGRAPRAAAEPWRLGGPGLDLANPVLARTAAEPLPTPADAHAGRYVVGRHDAETYLLPQRELLLTLHVPTRTEAMCAAQNAERRRRQVRAGHAAAGAQAWPTDQLRLTSARRAAGQFANATAANATGASRGAAAAASAPTAPDQGTSPPLLASSTSYEVRALPGDVVFVPRGWGVEVRRILGTAALHQSYGGGSADGAEGGDHDASARVEFWHHRAVSSPRGVSRPPPSRAPPLRRLSDQHSAPPQAAAACGVEVESVEVDALCLHYRPYPELTEAQAAVYVAANYVHGGVEEFYNEGGNRVHRVYE